MMCSVSITNLKFPGGGGGGGDRSWLVGLRAGQGRTRGHCIDSMDRVRANCAQTWMVMSAFETGAPSQTACVALVEALSHM